MRFKLPAVSWAMYDFATNIFAMNVVSLYFVLWVTVEKGRPDIYYSVAMAVSMAMAAVAEVLLGTLSDLTGRRRVYLAVMTASCAAATAALALTGNVFAGLAIFVMANFLFQVGTVFYNTFLPSVAEKGRVGELSGLGVALGYAGSFVGIALTRPFVLRWGYQAAFVPTGILFLLFSLPCLLIVKDPSRAGDPKSMPSIRSVWGRIKRTFSPVEGYPHLVRFLVASFIFFNAVNTVIIFMSVYAKMVFGVTDDMLIGVYLVSAFFAALGSMAGGVFSDRGDSKTALTGALVLWVVALLSGAFLVGEASLWVIGPLVGMALGATWASGRVLAIELAPPEKLGEVFGIFGVVGKFSAMVGPLLWGLSVEAFGFLGDGRYRAALLVQGALIVCGLVMLTRTDVEQGRRAASSGQH